MVFHIMDIYSATLAAIRRNSTFLHRNTLDPYFRSFVSPIGHSHHRRFHLLWRSLRNRPPAYRQHHPPLDSFPQHNLFGLLSADFTELLTHQLSLKYASRSIRVGVSGRYPIIPPIGLSVLLITRETFRFVLLLVP